MLMPVAEWAESRPDLYSTGLSAWDWRWRRNKRRYVEAGAVLLVGGRRMIDPHACEAVELAIAREATRAMLDREADA